MALLTNVAKQAGLPWDSILSAELVRHYKPDREVYLSAADFLGLNLGDIMMVAAHFEDLRAARECGLRTGFIHRPNEFGAGERAENARPGEFDVEAADTLDLANQLGA